MAHPDLENLLELLLDSARTTLEAAGEFLPFAAVVDAKGRLSLLEAEPPEEELDISVFVEALRQGIRRSIRAGDVVAAGICANVHASLPDDGGSSDAIVAELERAGEAFDVFQPYELEEAGARYAPPFAVAGQLRLFETHDLPN